jgi:hypothetical protein
MKIKAIVENLQDNQKLDHKLKLYEQANNKQEEEETNEEAYNSEIRKVVVKKSDTSKMDKKAKTSIRNTTNINNDYNDVIPRHKQFIDNHNRAKSVQKLNYAYGKILNSKNYIINGIFGQPKVLKEKDLRHSSKKRRVVVQN